MSFRTVRNLEDDYPANWPPRAYYVPQRDIEHTQALAFRELVEASASETVVDRFLRKHADLLLASLHFTAFGHHAGWVIPQQLIRPSSHGGGHGLKPDYIIGGKGSDGISWYVMELKGVNERLFEERNKRLQFTVYANRGICQLLEYLDYCAEHQAYFRDVLKLTDFREPKGFLILGRESEFDGDERRQRMKAMWNRLFGGRLQIRTWDALLRSQPGTWAAEQNRGMLPAYTGRELE